MDKADETDEKRMDQAKNGWIRRKADETDENQMVIDLFLSARSTALPPARRAY